MDTERAPSEAEAWFDTEIAPALLALADRCRERGISFINVVELHTGERATTVRLTSSASQRMQDLRNLANSGDIRADD